MESKEQSTFHDESYTLGIVKYAFYTLDWLKCPLWKKRGLNPYLKFTDYLITMGMCYT